MVWILNIWSILGMKTFVNSRNLCMNADKLNRKMTTKTFLMVWLKKIKNRVLTFCCVDLKSTRTSRNRLSILLYSTLFKKTNFKSVILHPHCEDCKHWNIYRTVHHSHLNIDTEGEDLRFKGRLTECNKNSVKCNNRAKPVVTHTNAHSPEPAMHLCREVRGW